jgi:hypothetical protein
MPNRYAEMEAKFGGNSWEQKGKKKTVHLAPGDRIVHTVSHN